MDQFVSRVREWGGQQSYELLSSLAEKAAASNIPSSSSKKQKKQYDAAIPNTLDLHYITDNLIASCQPGHAVRGPTFDDTGRDTWQDAYDDDDNRNYKKSDNDCRDDDTAQNDDSNNVDVGQWTTDL